MRPKAASLVTALATLSAVTLAVGALDDAQLAIGACGGIMTGYDGRPYTCDPNRKPVCDRTSGRCVCLERLDCDGGTRDEPF